MTVHRKIKWDVSSSGLHILAMGLMLCDHLWATLLPSAEWLTCAGRVAFPIFAFLTAEGYAHTSDLRRYMRRLLFWAVLSEIPFNLMCGGSIVYPYHQNVLWTFLISLGLIALMERCRERFRPMAAAFLQAGLVLLGFVLGYAAMTDYFGVGVLTVLAFYFFRGRSWKKRLLQLVCLYILHVHLLGGYYYAVSLFGFELEVVQQGFALLALLPIWLYQGRRGVHNKGFRYFCYAFYPAHMLLLFLIQTWMMR